VLLPMGSGFKSSKISRHSSSNHTKCPILFVPECSNHFPSRVGIGIRR
jgi:hypothetical protein